MRCGAHTAWSCRWPSVEQVSVMCSFGNRWCASWRVWPWPVSWSEDSVVSKPGPPLPWLGLFHMLKTFVSRPTPCPPAAPRLLQEPFALRMSPIIRLKRVLISRCQRTELSTSSIISIQINFRPAFTWKHIEFHCFNKCERLYIVAYVTGCIVCCPAEYCQW